MTDVQIIHFLGLVFFIFGITGLANPRLGFALMILFAVMSWTKL